VGGSRVGIAGIGIDFGMVVQGSEVVRSFGVV